MDNTIGKVPFLLASAQVSVTLGTDMVKRLQFALHELLADQDIEALKQHIENGTATSNRDLACIGISSLLTHIYKEAHATGQTEMKELTLSDLQLP